MPNSIMTGWRPGSLSFRTPDPRSQYFTFAAIRLYAQVDAPKKRHQMYEFVYRAYLKALARYWRWLAEAAIGAKHKLGISNWPTAMPEPCVNRLRRIRYRVGRDKWKSFCSKIWVNRRPPVCCLAGYWRVGRSRTRRNCYF